MTKVTVTFHENESGNVECDIAMEGQPPIYKREADYANSIKELMRSEIPKLCIRLGGVGTVGGETAVQKGN